MKRRARSASLPLVDLKAQYASIRRAAAAAIDGVLDSQHFILGAPIERFEREFAAYLGARHCVAVQSGTSALWLGLLACGVRPGDEVLTTPLTFFATVEAILLCRARPVFVDVDPKTLLLDPDKAAAAVGPRTRAIVPVHLYGQCAEMDPLRELARSRGLVLFEDAAQAAGSSYKGRMAGTLGRASAFSFYPGKNLGAYGDAGAVVTDDEAVAARVRRLRNHGSERKNYHDVLGLNARLDSFQGAVLSVKLPRLDAWNRARERHARAYRRALAGTPGLSLVADRGDGISNRHLFVIRHPDRDGLLEHLRSRGIQADVHYPVPAHLQPACGAAARPEGSFPAAEAACREILSLPLFPEMTAAQRARVIAEVRRFCRARTRQRPSGSAAAARARRPRPLRRRRPS